MGKDVAWIRNQYLRVFFVKKETAWVGEASSYDSWYTLYNNIDTRICSLLMKYDRSVNLSGCQYAALQ
jgi:hypothetical protein